MSVSLFRRWRSQRFSDLVGQEAVVSTLQNVLGSGSPARAYLFCGPRGTGKTSSARIFAKALNCENGPAAEPCNKCSQCTSIADGSNLDVFEIDAASHTQVDKIRDFIVEKVHFTPVVARHKVYIIDEVHKLSTSSFNALLKTLEEPPSHVVFILATTHPHEMPPTILSRCQRYDFRPLTAAEAESHLNMIAGIEKIDLEEDAARQLARAADGSLRDALVLFEQAIVFSDGKVTREKVLDLLGGVGYEVLEEMFVDLQGGNAAGALRRLDEWVKRGRDLKRLAESFQNHLRILLLLKVRAEDQSISHLSAEERASLDRICKFMSVSAITGWLKQVMEMLAQIRDGHQARLEWEMFLVGLALPETDSSLEGLERRVERVEASGGGGGSVALSGPALARLDSFEAKVAGLERRIQELADRPVPVAPVEPPAPPVPVPVAEPVVPERREEPAELESWEEEVGTWSGEVYQPTPIYKEPVFDSIEGWLEMPEPMITGSVEMPAVKTGTVTMELGQLGEQSPAVEPESLPESEPVVEESVPPPAPEPAPEAIPEPVAVVPKSVASEPAPVVVKPEPVAAEPVPVVVKPEPVAVEPATVVAEPEPVAVEPPPEPEPAPSRAEPVKAKPEPAAPPPAQGQDTMPEPNEFWRRLIQMVKEQDIRLSAVMADAKLVSLEPGEFHLGVPEGYQWHFTKVQEGRSVLESVASKLAGQTMRMACSLGGEKAAPPKDSEHDDLVQRAAGVFGGASIVD